MKKKPFDYWRRVLWSDEFKFNLFGSDRKTMVLRTIKEEYMILNALCRP